MHDDPARETIDTLSVHDPVFREDNNSAQALEHLWLELQKTSSLEEKENRRHELNIHLRYFIHIFQDVHQPLHTANILTRDFPDGDAGGTLWRFPSSKKRNKHLRSQGQWECGVSWIRYIQLLDIFNSDLYRYSFSEYSDIF